MSARHRLSLPPVDPHRGALIDPARLDPADALVDPWVRLPDIGGITASGSSGESPPIARPCRGATVSVQAALHSSGIFGVERRQFLRQASNLAYAGDEIARALASGGKLWIAGEGSLDGISPMASNFLKRGLGELAPVVALGGSGEVGASAKAGDVLIAFGTRHGAGFVGLLDAARRREILVLLIRPELARPLSCAAVEVAITASRANVLVRRSLLAVRLVGVIANTTLEAGMHDTASASAG